ncbi:hypothetical protein LSTR_LSTR000017 [Laodelphax striatellus]|uniref:Uncharacterized protein n=1 Tax=Laodelphax striatellus TaxID=195883 RepID=A0A482X6G6_LAOST|nr:hypothetical protein LSTR_LSTR000017 [Laodelphax striatellus]
MAVSLAEVISVRALQENEVWALLCQSAQAIQDVLLSNGDERKMPIPASVRAEGLKLTPRGRVILAPSTPSTHSTKLSDMQIEKMLIYSLGVTVKQAVNFPSLSQDLKALLEAMTSSRPDTRASLMDVLNGVADHCLVRGQSRPFSHLLMELHRQVLSQVKNIELENNVNEKSSNTSTSTLNKVEKKRNKVQRAGSRLYRADISKYHCPNTCIGPEFIVRALPSPKVIHIGDVKPALRRKLVVILLNGKKIEINCDPSNTTAANIFEVIVESECIEQNFLLGLATLVSGDFVFLAPETKLYKVAPSGWIGESHRQPYYKFILYLRIIFYLPSLRGIGSWSTKHMLYLQIRRGLLEHQIRCSANEIMTFASLALQAEFGDFNNEEHGNGDYFLLEHYIPDHFLPSGRKEQDFLHDLLDLHRSRKGLDPGRAEELFVAQAMQLPEYGFHFFSALLISTEKDESNCDVWLGISGKGITVCPKESCSDSQMPRSKLTSHTTYFAWNEIKKLTYTKQSLEIISKGASSKMKLKMQSNKSFSAFHLASLHHKFFLKLRNEMSSLHTLSQEFGIPVKSNGRSCQTIGVHYLGSKSAKPISDTLKRSASFCTPERVIFRGKTASHCAIDNNRSIQRRNDLKLNRRKEPEIEAIDAGEDTYWEHSPFEQEISSAPSSPTTETSQTSNRRLRAPLMGTRAFLGASQAELRESHSPLPQVYVLNSSIKSIDDKYHVDFQETISESLAEKFDEIPFVDERILTTVRITRGENGSFGVQVTEGSDGGVYIQNVVPNGSASNLGIIHKGDQIQAVDGHNVMNLQYSYALQLLQNAGSSMELVLAQKNRGQQVVQHSNVFNYTPYETIGIDLLAAIVQKPIEESYLRVIRFETETETDEKLINITLPRNNNKKVKEVPIEDIKSLYL